MARKSSKSIAMLIIDPQVDFHPGGTLAISTANGDSDRISAFIKNHADDIDDIFISLDSHNIGHIATSVFWTNGDGTRMPDPFTIISCEDIMNGIWKPADSKNLKHTIDYTRKLEAAENGEYKLIIWPEHCIIGSPGQSVVPSILEATKTWSSKSGKTVQYHKKGMNNLTEMYSIMKAEVPVDKATSLNQELIDTVSSYDILIVCGEALSHCVKYSALDILRNWKNSNDHMVLLEDGSSPVGGFEAAGMDFISYCRNNGVQVLKINELSQLITTWRSQQGTVEGTVRPPEGVRKGVITKSADEVDEAARPPTSSFFCCIC